MKNCTGRNCPIQVGKVDPETCAAEGCPWRTEPQTNADCIRDMTDEKLAEWIANEIWKAFAQGAGSPFFNQEEAVKLEKQEWLDWLKQEAQK